MNFPHIFAGSYAAAYYSYLWADVMAADLHAAFQDAGPSNSTAAHALGRSFRDAFLASGGSVHPRELFLRVRGRSPRVQPLLRFSGLSG
jgi:oligopeptidase A